MSAWVLHEVYILVVHCKSQEAEGRQTSNNESNTFLHYSLYLKVIKLSKSFLSKAG